MFHANYQRAKIINMSDTQLSEYRRAGLIMPQKILKPATSREKLIELLKAEKVSEFNALRDREGLEEIDLIGANLSRANLSRANLLGANLHKAVLIEAVLLGANLSGANLLGEIILVEGPNYQETEVSDANFEGALINDSGFLEYLRENGAKNVPDEVSTKDEFINAMKKREWNLGDIEQFFDE